MKQKKQVAMKDLVGKVQMNLIPPFAHEMLAMVYTWGTTKYATHNWMKGLSWAETIGAMERHINKIKKGELLDAESGLPHAMHIAWQAFTFYENMRLHPELNDLPKFPKEHLYNKKIYLRGYKKKEG